ncbi:conserved hypothetical protein [Beggiatoa sp. PS]|nr:conserved hypothetical protein [Beggiatoa sp. PS]
MIMYLFDTDTIIYWLNGNQTIENKVNAMGLDKIAYSIISQAELYFGAYQSNYIKENLTGFENQLGFTLWMTKESICSIIQQKMLYHYSFSPKFKSLNLAILGFSWFIKNQSLIIFCKLVPTCLVKPIHKFTDFRNERKNR